MARPRKYPDELMQRGVQLAIGSGRPIAHIAKDLGMHPETFRKRVRQGEADEGLRPDQPTWEERDEIKPLRKENLESRRANGILKAASVLLPPSSTQTDRSERVHQFSIAGASASSRFAGRWACRRPPTTTAPRAYGRLVSSPTSGLLEVIRVTHKTKYEAFGYRRTRKALLRAGERVPRCQVQRLMRAHGIHDAKRRGKPWRTTTPDPHPGGRTW